MTTDFASFRSKHAYATQVSKIRKVLKRLPKEMTEEVKLAILNWAKAIHADALAGVPVDEGDLAQAIEFYISPDKLSAKVGVVPGPGARRGRRREEAFYGKFIEGGTKGAPDQNIPPQPARPFLEPAFDMNKAWGKEQLEKAIMEAMKKAASRAGMRLVRNSQASRGRRLSA